MKPKKQNVDHYVPQLLLRNFFIGGSRQIHVFDKHNDRTFKTSVRNVASERGFYDFVVDGRSYSLDPILTDLEGRVANVVQKLVMRKNLSELSRNERAWLLIFVTFQFLRGPQFRETTRQMNESLADRIRGVGGDPQTVEGFEFLDENGVKEFACSMLMDAKDYFEHFWVKDLALFQTSSDDPFYIGDNPVALHNENDFGPYGNIGLALPGIEIYIPLSRTLTLALWCPTVTEKLRSAHVDARKSIERFKAFDVLGHNIDRRRLNDGLAMSQRVFGEIDATISALDAGMPIECSTENVIRFNSHQVTFSHRFVMSSKSDFSLVTKMIEDNEEYRRGLMPKIG